MRELLLHPDDVLFFGDGRPMEGGSPGLGATVPMPHVLDAALHAAFHRAFPSEPLPGERRHRGRGALKGEQRFGALTSSGLFFARGEDWFFPVPADLQSGSRHPDLFPLVDAVGSSSLPPPLRYPVLSAVKPNKDEAPAFVAGSAYENYLAGTAVAPGNFAASADFFAAEYSIGIEINDSTNTTVEGKFFSSEQMRLRDDVALATYASLPTNGDGGDGIDQLFAEQQRIVVGGQLRSCTVQRGPVPERGLNLPAGGTIEGKRVKFVLLTPAIFPRITEGKGRPHPGGWLPNWVDPADGAVALRDGPGVAKARRLGREPGKPIRARLVAASVGRPSRVSGWTYTRQEERAGAKSTLLAVPAGSIYYFEAEDEAEAAKLATALNWNGRPDSHPKTIINRRSTLMGEKGFGLGVCACWLPYPGRA